MAEMPEDEAALRAFLAATRALARCTTRSLTSDGSAVQNSARSPGLQDPSGPLPCLGKGNSI